MAGRWFRFYAKAMRDPKVLKLSDKDFRLWVELLSIAAENDGAIPPLEDLKHVLRRRLDHLKGGVDRLIRGGLIDPLEGGYEPHHWDKFQYKSDTSTDRVKKYRQKRNVSETPPDTETDTEVSVAKATAANDDSDKVFWDSAKAYLGKSKAGMIGRWVSKHGQEETARAITAAQIARAVDPIPYIERVLRGQKSGSAEMTMPC